MDTIFAPITASSGAISVIRISGSQAFKALEHLSVDIKPDANKVKFASIFIDNELLDEAVFAFFVSPKSFTGEDTIEISVHGSRYIMSALLDRLSKIPNFRFAKPGEFTKRALLNGKIDAIESEGINALIRAESRNQHKLASGMLSGSVSLKYDKIRSLLIDGISQLEAIVDFPEDEIPQDLMQNVSASLYVFKAELEEYLEDAKRIKAVSDGISIAIIGKPNAGKSSLINLFTQKDTAIVSHIAGTTRDVISAEVDISGYKVNIFDTAGIRESEDEIEQEGVKRARNLADVADIQIVLIDINDIDEEFLKSIAWQKSEGRIVVLNKIDQASSQFQINDAVSKMEKYLGCKCVAISALNGENFNNLIQNLSMMLDKNFSCNNEPMIFNERHKSIIISVLNQINEIDFSKPIEFLIQDFYSISKGIDQITGQIYNDDILESIFSKFCIGK